MLHEQHGRRIHVLVRQFHVRIGGSDAAHNIAPQPRAFQHIGFVHRQNLVAAGASEFKSHARDALDLVLAVTHGVQSFPGPDHGSLPGWPCWIDGANLQIRRPK